MKVEVKLDLYLLQRALGAEVEAAMLRVALDDQRAHYEQLIRQITSDDPARDNASVGGAKRASASNSRHPADGDS